MAFGIAAVAYLYPNSRAFAAGQCALLLALVAALALLARFPLLDPVQAGVVLIYLWFGLGPVTILLAAVAKGSALAAWDEQSHGVLALPLVAVGLVLYAAAGRAALRVTSLFGPHFHFFGWGLSCFRPSTEHRARTTTCGTPGAAPNGTFAYAHGRQACSALGDFVPAANRRSGTPGWDGLIKLKRLRGPSSLKPVGRGEALS